MAFSMLIALLQDAPPVDTGSSQKTIQIVAGVLALVLVVIIVMRRRGRKNKGEEEEF
jgi:LPXTG-motif cell wall-anchored protein